MNVEVNSVGAGQAGGRIRAALRAGVLTAVVFAGAALLALLVVGPRYEATFSIPRNGENPADARSQLGTDAFRVRVAARLREAGDWQGEPPPLSERLAALLDGRSPGPGGEDRDPALFSQVAIDAAAGQILVTANASRPSDAARLAEAVGRELSRASSAAEPSGAAEAAARLAEARATLDALRAETPAVAQEDAEAHSRRNALDDRRAEAQDLDRQVAEADATLGLLRSLAAEPSRTAMAGERLSVALGRVIEQHRDLQEATSALAETLPDSSPRLRIAQTRLAELAQEIARLAATEITAVEATRSELERRRAALSDDIEALEGDITAGLAADGIVAEHAERVRTAQAEVDALEADARARSHVATTTAGTLGTARAIEPPFLTAVSIAFLTGFVVGAAGSVAQRLAGGSGSPGPAGSPARSSGPSAPGEAAEPRGDEHPAVPMPHAHGDDERGDIALDEAVAALSASRISRVLVVSGDAACEASPSLALSRALARDGQLVLLIDLSPSQAAAREAGIPSRSKGFAEVVSGTVGLSSATFADEESAADIVCAGAGGSDGARRIDALRFARRAYDQVVVDCGTSPAADLLGLADENAAILVATQERDETPAFAERLREFEDVGLDTAILRL